MNTFQHAVRPAPLASSLRDTEWRQLCRHSELQLSSLLPQSLRGRLSSSASVLCGAGSALVRMRDLRRADMSSCYLPPHLVHVHMWGWTCSCNDVPVERGSLLCLSWHVWLWQSPHPTRSCCHMLPGFCLCCARATSPQRILARRICSADGTCFSSAYVFPGEQTAPCWLLTAAEKRPVKVILSLMRLWADRKWQ